MKEKPQSSITARIASYCGLCYILACFLLFAAAVLGGVVGACVILACFILIPLLGIAGIVLGIISLCRLTPEEKSQGVWTSGTTKNLAVVGIAVPPAMTVLTILISVLCGIALVH